MQDIYFKIIFKLNLKTYNKLKKKKIGEEGNPRGDENGDGEKKISIYFMGTRRKKKFTLQERR